MNDTLKKYDIKLRENIGSDDYVLSDKAFSREYGIFREELLGGNEKFYEKLAKLSGKLLNIKPKEDEYKKLKDSIERTHLHIRPEDATAFGILSGISLIFLGITIFAANFIFTQELIFLLPSLIVLVGAFIIKPLSYLPNYFANKARLEASNQMVLCILYVVMFMRHTSNLEHAIKFSGEHVGKPLSLDLRKIFWDVETGKYSTIKESLDTYLEGWRDYNLEFVEAFHLIEGSLYEASEQRRLDLLDKSLEVILQGTYEKMLHFAQDLKTPITMLHMLGIILPILGLVIFPLIASFLQGAVKWYHLAFLYNLILPVGVYIFGINILNKRPTGYGESNILKTHPEFLGKNKLKPFMISFVIGFAFVLVGLLPLILHYTNPELNEASLFEGSAVGGKLLDYKCSLVNGVEECIGPYGLGALILSLFIPFGFALGIFIYYRLRTKETIGIQRNIEKLEREFSGSLFQLGNRVGDGIPVEIAFGDVAENMRGTPSGDFFRNVSMNIRQFGMDVKRAIFDDRKGAILNFPSNLIESSMKVLLESSRKGPMIVSKSLIAISMYVDRIHNVNERLKDLLSEILSSMKSQISFLAPMIAGIVVGVGSMVVAVINKLSEQFANVQTGGFGGEVEGVGNVGALADILRIEHVVPSFHFQLIVGLYVVEIIIILTILSNIIENGFNNLVRDYNLSKNILIGTGLYVVIAFIGIFIFNILASGISFVAGS